MQVTGANFTDTYDHAAFKPGSIAWSDGGDAYLFGQAQNDFPIGNAIAVEGSGGTFRELNANSAQPGRRVGVTVAAVDTHEYCWVQVYGASNVRTSGINPGQNGTRLYSSGTAGQIHSATSSNASELKGIAISANASNGRNDCNLNFPHCST